MANIKVGFIGCGGHSGNNIYPSLRPAGLELVAVCDKDPSAAEKRAAEYNLKTFYTNYREMCDTEKMDAVLVVIGPEAHYEYAIALVEQGYHVWTEKPCAATATQADEMVQAAEETERIIQIGFNYRYTMGIQKALSLIQSGRCAQPGTVTVHWWLGCSDLIGFWHHYMVHAVDLLRYVAGAHLTLTHAEYRRRDDINYYIATFRTADGDCALLDLSSSMPLQGHWAQVDWNSSDGILSVVDFTKVNHYMTRSGTQDPYDGDHIWRTESMFTKNPFIQTWGYMPELVLFREAVQTLRNPEATIREAAWGMHVCEELVALAKA